jgi:hypothetical protein
MKYVKEKWATFDAVVVTDGKRGRRPEEQPTSECSQTIWIRKTNHYSSNKVYDPDDEEQVGLIKEARLKVEEIFLISAVEMAVQSSRRFQDVEVVSSAIAGLHSNLSSGLSAECRS